MSRSGYYENDGDDNWRSICWQGAVKSATNGKRGQALLRDLLAALDAMPEKRLVAGELQADGEFCALGVVGHAKGLDLAKIDTEDWPALSTNFNIAEALAREIMYVNDEAVGDDEWVRTGEPYPNEWKRIAVTDKTKRRWEIVRAWVAKSIADDVPAGAAA